MQGLEVFAQAHCASLGKHCSRLSIVKLRGAELSCERCHLLFAKNAQVAAVHSKSPLPIRKWWGCRGSFEEHANSEELVSSLTEEPEAISDKAPAEDGATCQVKFVLIKKCRYGERFNVVGNHPVLGNWNPDAAIPMDWADGHIWSADVSIPVRRQLEFKFVLSRKDGKIEWQPGPNQIFETVEDVSPLVVSKLWDYEENGASADLPQKTYVLKEDTVPISSTELSAVVDTAGLDEAAKEELVDKIGAEVVEVNGQAPSSASDSVESTERASEVPFAETNLAATAVDALIDGDKDA